MKRQGNLEVEVKLRVADPAAARRKLSQLRARKLEQVHERNMLFDTPSRALAKRGRLLRLRVELPAGTGGARRRLTFKGPAARGGRYKVRQEIETPVADPLGLLSILEAVGLRIWFEYEKQRTSYRLPGVARLRVELDRTPIGWFFELEGPAEAIDRGARRLGYDPMDYLTQTYLELYCEDCRARGVRAGDMLFGRPPRGGRRRGRRSADSTKRLRFRALFP